MKTRQPQRIGPDSDLHIYYLEGRVPRQGNIRNADFIGNWEEDGFSFLFFKSPAGETVNRLVASYPKTLKLIDSYRMTYAEWQGGRVEPVQIGRFLLTPPWTAPPPNRTGIDIALDPGVVFGTGTHPTTQDCLVAIERACSDGRIKTLLDLGTGTGVLALAAIKLGCRQAVAVDFNFLAAKTALENVRLNRMENQVLVVNGQAEHYTDYPADLLVANIHYDVMRHLVQSEGFSRKAWFVLSGLLRSEAKQLAAYLANQPVKIVQRWDQDGIWHTFLGKSVNH